MKPGPWMQRIGLANGPFWRKHTAGQCVAGVFGYTVTTLQPYYRWRWSRCSITHRLEGAIARCVEVER